MRSALTLLCLLTFFLLLGVVIPQERVLGQRHFAALVEAGDSWVRFFLVDLQLGRMSTVLFSLRCWDCSFCNLLSC